MLKLIGLLLVAGSAAISYRSIGAASEHAAVDQMFVLDCGEASAPDLSQWSPGAHQGRPITYSNNCYLIRHGHDWLLWDTGISDAFAELPEGKVVAHHVRGVVRRTLASQLQEIGLGPNEVTYIAFSHAHFDHVGNSRLFTRAKWLVQQAEYDAMFGNDARKFGFLPDLYRTMKDNPLQILNGDHDVFGDGAVRVIATPGHTPGHQSLLVRLPNSSPVILSGDAAHLLESFSHRRVPSFNADAASTRASIDKLSAIAEQTGAKILVNHDREQSAAVQRAWR
jgi:N-acyl homoserine lactone hydrolase